MDIKQKRLIFGSDHAGIVLKTALIQYLTEEKQYECVDVGTSTNASCDYPDFSVQACAEILKDESNNVGILICGSGIGISIVANQVKGIRCSLCHDYNTAQHAKEKLNSNVIAFGQRVIGIQVCKQAVDVFLDSVYTKNEESEELFKKLSQLEDKYLSKN